MKKSSRRNYQIPSFEEIEIFRRNLLDWFDRNGRTFPWRRPSNTNYQYILAEILLQRTKAETVAQFFSKFSREYPSWRQLNLASIEELQRFLQPIGLWRRRATSIKALSHEMVKRNGRFPKVRSEIESLPGIGQYIANSVLLFCHAEPQPLLDANMARVLERVFGPRTMADIRYDPYIQQLALEIVNCETPKEINWAILDLAAIICSLKNPSCKKCPLSIMCKYFQRKK